MPLSSHHRKLRLLAPALLLTSLHSQTPSPHPPAITVNARLVVLDVVVTDKNGAPVNGLTEKDFQVYEDGKLQKIRSVEPPSLHALPQSTATAGVAAVFDPAQPTSFGHAPVTILLLDQLNTHFADSSFARRSLHDYLARQPAVLTQPTTLYSLYDNHLKLLQGYTLDRSALDRALASVPTKYAWELEVNGKAEHGPIDRLDQSLRALEEIAQSSAAIPGRKNLVWVGGGFPTLDSTTLDSDNAREIKDTLKHVTNVLLDSRVTLYAVDPTSTAPGMTEITNAEEQAFATATGGGSLNSDPYDAKADFDQLGPVTGGRIVRSRNDIAAQIASSVDLGASFYTIAYSPTSANGASAKFRQIKVVCLRPGLLATTRTGYYAGQTLGEKSTASAAYDLTLAAQSPMPLTGLRITAIPDTSVNAPPNTYIVRVGSAGLEWKPNDDGSSKASVYVMAVSLRSNNDMLGHTLHGMTANAKPGTDLRDPQRLIDFSFKTEPSPKATTLRFIVRDSATGRTGSFDLPIPRP